MATGEYEIIQMHVVGNTNALQFPRVPLEAVCESVDKRDTPIGKPATVVELMAITSTAPTPTKAGQRYFNTTMSDRKVHTSVENNGAFAWDAGVEPSDGVLYSVREGSPQVDTLYVKSVVGTVYNGLVKLQSAVATVSYAGPFHVQYTKMQDNVCKCSIVDDSVQGTLAYLLCGYVITVGHTFAMPAVTDMIVNDRSVIYLYVVDNSGTISCVIQAGNYSGQGTPIMSVRLAVNRAGDMIQCQYGDIVLGNLTV